MHNQLLALLYRFQRKLIVAVILVFFLPWIVNCTQNQAQKPAEPTSWTFMVYMDGDNDLEPNGIDNFLWMSSVGSSSEVSIVVQFDRIRLPMFDDKRYEDWTSAKRYYVTKDMTPVSGDALSDLGEINMGDPQALIDFVQWSASNYPADHYALVIWDHGSGWKPKKIQLSTDFTNGFDGLTMQELQSALSTLTDNGAQPLDLIIFDACMMAMIEVDNQLLPFSLVRVASEAPVPSQALPYNEILSLLTATPSMTSTELGEVIVQEYYDYYQNYTLSALPLGNAYNSLNLAVDNFALALIDNHSSYRNQIDRARSNTIFFFDRDYIDLYDFAHQVNLWIADPAINSSATAVMNEVENIIIAEQHGEQHFGDAHGITIYFPTDGEKYDSLYDGASGWLDFTADNHWDEWLRTYFSAAEMSDFLYLPFTARD